MRRPSPAKKLALNQMEPIAIRKLKQQFREKKRLIIEGGDLEVKEESSSLIVARR